MKRLHRHCKVNQQELLKAVREAYEVIVESHAKKHKSNKRQITHHPMGSIRH